MAFGKGLDFTITRATIELHPVKASIHQNPKLGKVGYIRLTSFSGKASAEMRDAIKDGEKKIFKHFFVGWLLG